MVNQLIYFSEIPDTLQGVITYKAYCEAQFKRNIRHNTKLEKLVIECERRIKEKCKSLQGEKNDTSNQTRSNAGPVKSESGE